MKVNAICIVKNEVDVVAETLLNAMQFCHKIYLFDNGSDDGTWELVQTLAAKHPQIEIAARSHEVFKNQLRNRVYNLYHQLYSANDWWYILDADEMLTQSPKPYLQDANRKGKDCMYVWMAQFYFTDKDQQHYAREDKSQPVSERRRYYRVNWREPRFFRNDPQQQWSEDVSGRFPPFSGKTHSNNLICRHYAQRTPEQIRQRNQLRIHNPFSFFHLKNKPQHSWLKASEQLFYYQNDGQFHFPWHDKAKYYASQMRYWLQWRVKSVFTLLQKLTQLKGKLVKG